MKILCRTLFDCTTTGVTGHMRTNDFPFEDAAGQTVDNALAWHRSRNQQRNYETLIQLISLRTQPMHVTATAQDQLHWQFWFETENENVYGPAHSVFENLLQDCAGVPMVTNLGEKQSINAVIETAGPRQNIWFEAINN
jgi:hypothetical protein